MAKLLCIPFLKDMFNGNRYHNKLYLDVILRKKGLPLTPHCLFERNGSVGWCGCEQAYFVFKSYILETCKINGLGTKQALNRERDRNKKGPNEKNKK